MRGAIPCRAAGWSGSRAAAHRHEVLLPRATNTLPSPQLGNDGENEEKTKMLNYYVAPKNPAWTIQADTDKCIRIIARLGFEQESTRHGKYPIIGLVQKRSEAETILAAFEDEIPQIVWEIREQEIE